MRKNTAHKGFLLEEALVACGLFAFFAVSLSMILFQVQSFLQWSQLRVRALEMADEALTIAMVALDEDFENASPISFEEDGFTINVGITPVDNFTKRADVAVNYEYQGRPITAELSSSVTDTRESEGQNSCRPNQDTELWKYPSLSTFDLGILDGNTAPIDIDIVGRYVYVASNGGVASTPDLYIFDISDMSRVKLISSLDTGPGLNALHATGRYVYAANSSITGQLQIIDVSDPSEPKLVSSYRLPGAYATSTPSGSAVFYKAGKIFLGTNKSLIEELHYIDVSSVTSPITIDSYEIGHGINDLFAFKDKVYVASPHQDELKIFSIAGNRLVPFDSYNAPGATGNGKRISLFLDMLFLGKTKTFDREEMIALSASGTPEVLFDMKLSASVQGILGYGRLLFVLLHQASESFRIFDISPSEQVLINERDIDLPGIPLDFDCDRDTFAIIFENSPLISFITHP